MLDVTTEQARASYAYVPRFRNLHKQETDFLRGYATTFGATRGTKINQEGVGEELKNNLMKPPELGAWNISSGCMGETIPKETNYVTLDKEQKDEWGIPLLKISIDYDENDEKMIKDFFEQFSIPYRPRLTAFGLLARIKPAPRQAIGLRPTT